VVLLLAQAARVPPLPPLILNLFAQKVLLGLGDQNLRLLHQARHVHIACSPAARAPAHEAFLRFPVERLRADEARLTRRVVRALLNRDRDGLLAFFVSVKLLGAAALFYLLAELVMAARVPVLLLASWSTVEGLAAATLLGRAWERYRTCGAMREDHFKPQGVVGRGSA